MVNSTTTATPAHDTPDRTPPTRAGAPGRLAGWCSDHRRLVLGLWMAALVIMSMVSGTVGSNYQDKLSGGASQAEKARSLLAERMPAQAGDNAQVVFSTDGPVTDPANQARIQDVIAQLVTLPHVAGVRSPFDQGGQAQVSPGGTIAYATLLLDDTSENIPVADVEKLLDTATAASADGFQVEIGGAVISRAEALAPGPAEAIGLLAAMVILLVAFGSVIAMGLPIITALFGIGIGYGVISLLSRWLVVPTFGPQMAAMIGIGVGIDYALFIVTRYRQGLAEGRDPRRRWCGPSTRQGGRCSSPAAPWSSRCWACSCSGARSSTGSPSAPSPPCCW